MGEGKAGVIGNDLESELLIQRLIYIYIYILGLPESHEFHIVMFKIEAFKVEAVKLD